MRRQLKILAFAIPLAAASAAVAQTNPLARGTQPAPTPFAFNNKVSNALLVSPLGGSKPVAPPSSSFGPLTPVPEPSEWAMLLAGLALVGFIVRRNVTRST